MTSSYKRLGNYIEPVAGRNKDFESLPLVGLSITKKFIPSIANTIGTDMSTYRIIERNQFAYGPVTSRNGDKITIALFDDYDAALISQAYIPFKVKDKNELHPEYLMMWFKRREFDRYARFKSHGSAREIFDWQEMCEVMLPIPSPEKQQQLVNEYHTLQKRIDLNNQLIAKLEETAQTIYKQWFVEGIDLENLPEGWRLGKLEDLYIFQYGKGNTNPDNGGKYPIYGSNGVIGGYHEYNSEDNPVIGHIGTAGSLIFAFGKHYVTYNGIICKVKNSEMRYFGYVTLLLKDLKEQVRGSTQPFVSYDMLYEMELILPKIELIHNFNKNAEIIFQNLKLKLQENQKLEELKELLLGKMAKRN